MTIAELLKRKGVIKRTSAEIAAIASRASNRISSPIDQVDIPDIPDNLRWCDVNSQWSDPIAYAWIGGHHVLRIKRNPSGRYRDKHLISIHTFYDNYNGTATINPDPVISRWHLCHFTEDRQQLTHTFK